MFVVPPPGYPSCLNLHDPEYGSGRPSYRESLEIEPGGNQKSDRHRILSYLVAGILILLLG
jgi:hypothetical protein